MDPQVIMIGIVAFVVSAVLIYLISAFGFKEKSYEEAIAEQKKRLEAEQDKVRKEKKAEKEKKKGKKSKDKPKEKNVQQVNDTEPERKMVNLEIEPEIIEPQLSSDQESKPKSKAKKNPKPILLNKDEKPKVAPQMQETIHFKATPKDEVELLHEHEKERKTSHTKPKKEEKIKIEMKEVKKAQPVVEDMVIVQTQKLQAAAPTPEKKVKKALENDVRQIVSSIQSASLNDGEIQKLIDILLNRQSGTDQSTTIESWNKKGQKGDPIALLKRQLEEKEKGLQEEQQLAMSSNNKYKELKQEVQKDKARFAAIEKQYQDKVAGKEQEFQALQLRMQTAINENMADRNATQARIQQLERQCGDQSRYTQLIEENKKLKEQYERVKAEAVPQAEFISLRQKVSIMENELSNNCSKLNVSENTRRTLESKLSKYEEEKKKLIGVQGDSEGVWSKRVDEVNQQLRKSEAEKNNLSKNLKAAEKECSDVKSQLQDLNKALSGNDNVSKELEVKLKGAEKERSLLETSLKAVEKKLAEIEKEKDTAQKEKSEFQTELKKIQEEKKKLDDEVKMTKEKLVKSEESAKTASAPNGDIHNETSGNKITMVEHEKILSEKTVEVKKLTTEVESRKNEITKIQEQLTAQKNEVNNMQEQLKSLKNENSNLKSQYDNQTQELSSVKADIGKKQSAVSSETEQLKKLQADIDAQKKKNNEQEQIMVTNTQKSDQALLQRLFPDVKVSEKLVHKEWMSTFEKEIQTYLVTLKSQKGSAKSDDSSKLIEDNKRLESQVEEFKTVLQTTENKLQQLENSVEGEERKWQQKLQELQLDLEQSRQDNSTLKVELEKSKGSAEALGELDFAYRCLEKSITKITDEMTEKVTGLKDRLKDSEDRCLQFQNKAKEAEVRISSLEEELNEKNNITQNLDDLLKKIEELKKSNKDLASTNVRLNGIIKTGQDSLSKETELVNELRKQIEERNKSSGATPSQENEDLKKKLADAEKQLDKEITANKQMSQKLAQLGVMAASQVNDLGTQV
ncbi:ribosome-binding protein 1-like isoform X6 [Mytilus californianus]|uniref:ribosome-binding protein 1-like isoform X6 n=1 Tax=Mytilus californianus TaxID=6549 RepID=UPI002246A62A|nr:ribosome-binding protein 1-like isoform X6 [Mytilus californianus]